MINMRLPKKKKQVIIFCLVTFVILSLGYIVFDGMRQIREINAPPASTSEEHDAVINTPAEYDEKLITPN